MSIDLNRLSAKELDALINQAKKRKTTLTKRKPLAVVRQKLTALARAEGYSIAELFGAGSSAKPAPAAAGQAHQHQGPQARQGRAEIPQPGQSRRNLGRPRPAAEMARDGNRQGPGAGRIPDQVGRSQLTHQAKRRPQAGVFCLTTVVSRQWICMGRRTNGAKIPSRRHQQVAEQQSRDQRHQCVQRRHQRALPGAQVLLLHQGQHPAQCHAAGHQHDDARHPDQRARSLRPARIENCRRHWCISAARNTPAGLPNACPPKRAIR